MFIYLHSTMYLLKPNQSGHVFIGIAYLHSTMYLLKHDEQDDSKSEDRFTFHHVSIKTSLKNSMTCLCN